MDKKVYFEALERLINGRPINVPKGAKITNDAVSLEAGRQKGSIKKSRPEFSELIEAITLAATAKCKPDDVMREQLANAKAETTKYRTLWEESLAREISLFKELWVVREEWKKERDMMNTGKVTSIGGGIP